MTEAAIKVFERGPENLLTIKFAFVALLSITLPSSPSSRLFAKSKFLNWPRPDCSSAEIGPVNRLCESDKSLSEGGQRVKSEGNARPVRPLPETCRVVMFGRELKRQAGRPPRIFDRVLVPGCGNNWLGTNKGTVQRFPELRPSKISVSKDVASQMASGTVPERQLLAATNLLRPGLSRKSLAGRVLYHEANYRLCPH